MISGARALFDQTYLPETLLHRDRELSTLSELFCLHGESPVSINVMCHGSFGVGRTTLLRFFGHHEMKGYCRPLISFHMKSDTEIIQDVLKSLTGSTPSTPILSELWLHLKRVLQKAESPVIFTFDDVDRTSQGVYAKFLALCKECRIPSMTTSPRFFPRQLSPPIIQNLDQSIELEPFSDKQLLDIVSQRVCAAFPTSLSPQILEFIADIICTLDFQRPATVVELLRMLYPVITKGVSLTADFIRQACLDSKTLHYDFWSSHLTSLTDLEVSTVLLLQGLGEYFLSNPARLYISRLDLFSQYSQVCERTGIAPTSTQFSRALNDILFQDLLLHSRYNSQNYFTLLPAQGYIDIVNLLLGDAEEC